MIPVGDFTRRNTTPYVNWTLIAINAAVFLYTITLSTTPNRVLGPFAISETDLFFYHWGFLAPCFADWAGIAHEASPRAVALFCPTDGREPLTLFTSMFMHAGWGHIGFNMLFLWIFGDNVEDRTGHLGYLLLYLASGLAGAAGHVLFSAHSTVPTLGASGAISGVMGAYLITFPRARILTLVPIVFFITTIEIPAFIILLYWILLQFLSGAASLGGGAGQGGVAWFAHVGGFVAGIPLMLLLRRPQRRRVLSSE